MGRRGGRGRWGESGGDGERVGEMGRWGEQSSQSEGTGSGRAEAALSQLKRSKHQKGRFEGFEGTSSYCGIVLPQKVAILHVDRMG